MDTTLSSQKPDDDHSDQKPQSQSWVDCQTCIAFGWDRSRDTLAFLDNIFELANDTGLADNGNASRFPHPFDGEVEPRTDRPLNLA